MWLREGEAWKEKGIIMKKVSLNRMLSDTFLFTDLIKTNKKTLFCNRFDYSIIFYVRQQHHFAFSGMNC